LARFNDAAARPAFGAGPEKFARPCSQTRILLAHQWRRTHRDHAAGPPSPGRAAETAAADGFPMTPGGAIQRYRCAATSQVQIFRGYQWLGSPARWS
jgi:hypothetical protein